MPICSALRDARVVGVPTKNKGEHTWLPTGVATVNKGLSVCVNQGEDSINNGTGEWFISCQHLNTCILIWEITTLHQNSLF